MQKSHLFLMLYFLHSFITAGNCTSSPAQEEPKDQLMLDVDTQLAHTAIIINILHSGQRQCDTMATMIRNRDALLAQRAKLQEARAAVAKITRQGKA